MSRGGFLSLDVDVLVAVGSLKLKSLLASLT